MGTKSLRFGKGTLNVPWNALDRAIESFAPQWAGRRLQARVGHALSAQMGGYNGASTGRRSLAGWHPPGGDADADTLADLPTLRARSRDLARNAPVGGGAINTAVTHVVGTGLSLQCAVDADLLQLSDDEADAWQQDTERKFNAWWESTDCDITRTQNGYGLTDLTFRGELEGGDVAAVLTQAGAWATGPVKLAVQLIEAERLCNPDRKPDSDTLVAGVEMDAAGAPVRYHFASANPQRAGSGARRKLGWTAVPAFGGRTGRRNVLHVFRRIRPGQTRGIPMLAPVIEPLKQLERYTEAELMAAVVSGMFTVFIQSEGNAQLQPSALEGQAASAGSGGGWDGKLGNGLVVEMGKGETIETANPGRPNAQFDPFVAAIVRQVGMLLEIPYEVLIKHYTSSYTAARAALIDAWRHFRVRRSHLVDQFCQPVYAAWLDEAVAVGYVRCPGYLANPLVRRAWQGANWIGDGPGAVDPVKEVESAERRVALNISTLEAESVLHDGGKLRPKLRQRQREQKLVQQYGLSMPAAQPGQAQQQQQRPAPDAPPVRPDGSDDDTET